MTNDFRSPMLLNVCFLLSNFFLINYPQLWVFTMIMTICAICDILIWCIEKSYKDKGILKNLKEELRLPPATTIMLIVGLFVYASDNNIINHPIVWIVAALLVADVIRQIINNKQYPYSKDW